ncbi:hypothetical protein V491_06803 [Pseudogymnoascus sp. VKM F-3775]|nr:hypothetical protein V491_06803 [Pseudogymnoascus sp. VKM F-3775]
MPWRRSGSLKDMTLPTPKYLEAVVFRSAWVLDTLSISPDLPQRCCLLTPTGNPRAKPALRKPHQAEVAAAGQYALRDQYWPLEEEKEAHNCRWAEESSH